MVGAESDDKSWSEITREKPLFEGREKRPLVGSKREDISGTEARDSDSDTPRITLRRSGTA